MYLIASRPVSSGYCLIRYSINGQSLSRRSRDAARADSIIGQVRPQPSLDLVDRCTEAAGVVFDLVSAHAPNCEVPRMRVAEIQAAHRRRRQHRVVLGEGQTGAARVEQRKQLLFLAMIGTRRVAKGRSDAAIPFGDEVFG